MTTIKIENLGPIVDSSTISISPITLLMGPQSAGKSTFMKVLCFCRWVEKKIMVSTDDLVKQYTHYGRFIKELKQFHRLNDDFFSKNTRIYYDSQMLSISYEGEKNPKISKKRGFQSERYNTKLSYIPAERNLVAAIKNVDRAYRTSERDALFNLIYEWDEARSHYTKDNPYPLSVTGGFRYFDKNGEDTFLMENGKSFPAFFASSGLQSVMPLEVMSKYFLSLVGTLSEFSKYELSSFVMEVLNGEGKEENDRFFADEKSIETLRRRLVYQSTQLYIEEPEQNLYPESQRLLLLSLIKALKQAQSAGSHTSSIVFTTHSPYILSVINVLFRAASVDENKKTLLYEIIPKDLILSRDSYSAYYLDNGRLISVLDAEVPMFSGNELDGVSDWVENTIGRLNDLEYGEENN